MALYPLYETRRDTFNIPRLLNILAKENTVSAKALANVTKLYTEAKALWPKVGILRNEAFGHRSNSHTIAQTFKEAGVTPNELKRLVELSKKLLSAITRALDGSIYAFNPGASDATVRVLKDLKTHHEG